MDEEEMNEKVKTMEWLWGADEARKVLGLLKGKKKKRENEERK